MRNVQTSATIKSKNITQAYKNGDRRMELEEQIQVIKGVGEKTAKSFGKLGIVTIRDLVDYYPRGYELFDTPRSISSLSDGNLGVIEGFVLATPTVKRVKHLQIISVRVQDSTGSISLSWFNMPFLQKTIKSGTRYIFRGKVVRKNGVLVMEQPKVYKKEEYEKLKGILLPVYPLSDGVSNHVIVKAMEQVLPQVDVSQEILPKRIKSEYHLCNRKKAIESIHFPKTRDDLIEARRRLVFDEIFLYMIALKKLREEKNQEESEFKIPVPELLDEFITSLPYPLTNAQVKVLREIEKDLSGKYIMNRLVQGDVGSGKTILAIISLLMTVKAGYQGCFMVPTEVLAKQHYDSVTEALEKYNVKIVLLVGSMTAKEKNEAYKQIKSHEADIIIGTHALFQEKAEYDNLGLVITDEQHRFGVKQREALMAKGKKPHVLVMSATPIPRTLALMMYGDLDISVIDELPAKRLPIKNCVVGVDYRRKAYEFIEQQVAQGRQAYVICPMVEESEVMEAENVLDYARVLEENLSPGITVSYLHGKMKPAKKNEIMDSFLKNEIQVLVSTTVVEVGVNVPNATVMMVENAERFGLAQLHQLRGRVGRGEHQSYCIFICTSNSREAKERLEILNKSNDGFYIANEDLRLRGPGDMFGIEQSGEMDFKLADIFQDAKIIAEASEAAKTLTEKEILTMKEQKNFKYESSYSIII